MAERIHTSYAEAFALRSEALAFSVALSEVLLEELQSRKDFLEENLDILQEQRIALAFQWSVSTQHIARSRSLRKLLSSSTD